MPASSASVTPTPPSSASVSPDIPRRVSGYNLDQLLPENGFNVARALVGSEGTCVTISRSSLRTEAKPAASPLGSPRIRRSIHRSRSRPLRPRLQANRPRRIRRPPRRLHAPQESRRRRRQAPPRRTWLPPLRVRGRHPGRRRPHGRRSPRRHSVLRSAPGRRRIHTRRSRPRLEGPRIRLGRQRLRPLGKRAVGKVGRTPPFRRINSANTSASSSPSLKPMATRLQCTVTSAKAASISASPSTSKPMQAQRNTAASSTKPPTSFSSTVARSPASTATDRARAALLPKMFGPELMQAFAEFKALWDPLNRMNPGKLIDPIAVYDPIENLRIGPGYEATKVETWFQYPGDHGSFSDATTRCVGVGACRKHDHGTMCPSYMATREEKHSTRGRAHLLWEMMQGNVIKDGWRSNEVKDALDLCLSCKACKTECPVNVDMATWKSEFLAHHYQGRVHPLYHYAFGFMDRFASLASLAPSLANLPMRMPGVEAIIKQTLGIARQRTLPRFAPASFTSSFKYAPSSSGSQPRPEVLLWPDTWNNYFPSRGPLRRIRSPSRLRPHRHNRKKTYLLRTSSL